MKKPLERMKMTNVAFESPENYRDFMRIMLDYRRKCNELLRSFRRSSNVITNKKISNIMEVKNLLDTMVWEFVSILKQIFNELKIEDKNAKETIENLESDCLNYMQYITTTMDSVFSGPPERVSYLRLAYLSQNLATIFNSLIGPCLLDAHNVSVRERPKVTFCDKKEFMNGLFESVKRHTGIFRRELFIMTRGKLQTAYLPQIPQDYKSVPIEKTKIEDLIPERHQEFVFEEEDTSKTEEDLSDIGL